MSTRLACHFYYLCRNIINVNTLGLLFLLSVHGCYQCQHVWLVVFIICTWISSMSTRLRLVVFIICAWISSMSTRLACCFYYLCMDIINVNMLKACRFYYLYMDIINVNTLGLLFLLSVHGYRQCQHA